MHYNRLDFIAGLHQLLQDRRYHEGLLFCEKAMKLTDDEVVLVEYVRLLLVQKYHIRAREVLVANTTSPFQSLNVLSLFEEYYSHTGNTSELRLLHENIAKREPYYIVNQKSMYDSCEHGIERLMHQFASELKQWSQQDHHLSKLLKKSYNLLKQGLIEEFNKVLQSVIDDDSHTLLSRYLSAEQNLLTGNLEKAEEAFQSLIEEYPRPAVIHDRLGDISSRRCMLKEAIRHYQYSLNYDNGSVQTWLELVECYKKIGNHTQAAACVQRLKKNRKLESCAISELESCLNNDTAMSAVKKVFGLVVHDGGGSLMPVEFVRTDTPGCQVTGNVSMTLYDSVQVAYNCVKNMVFGKDALCNGIMVNIPRSISYKDGPSAGMAFGIGIMAVLRDLEVPAKVAFTGEIDLSGGIYPVGGINNKILAAWYNNVKHVWLPAENYPEITKLPDDVKRHMTLVFVQSLNMVVKDLWK